MPVRKDPGVSLLDFPYKNHTAGNRIHKIASGEGYQYKSTRRRSGKRATHTIGVVVHELQSDFIRSALQGMEEVANTMGYELVITHSQESMAIEVANAQMLFDQQVDGLIASLSFDTTNVNHFKNFAQQGIPVVFFDRVEKAGGNSMVVIDNVGMGYAATQHLIGQGCHRIAIITSCLDRNVYADRYTGFRHALRNHQLPYADHQLIINDITEAAGVEAARQVMEMREMPDGLFITNDLVAAACMRALMDNDVRVPEDIAIVGFNNDSISKLTFPTITTINYPGIEMGRVAALQLIEAMEGGNYLSQKETAIVPADLIVRCSSLKNAIL
jgi:LacI family transcriptional regulator